LQAGTLREVAGNVTYSVRLPEAGLSWEKMGPLFERYSVALVGTVDSHWAEAYKRVVATSPGLSRFRLNKDQPAVSFTCRATDGPVEVMKVLKILEGVIERVNREAALPEPAELETVPARTIEPRRGKAGARPQHGGFFARLALGSK
jgi:hypothetical protein